MLDRPTCYYRVNAPMLYPIAAATGDLLALWPGHPTHTLTVCVAGTRGQKLRRFAYVPDGVVYGALLSLLNDDALTPLTESAVTVLCDRSQSA